MRPFLMHSTKYDGSLHYRYPVQLVERSEDRLVTYCEPGIQIQSYRGSSVLKIHILSLFWRNRPYVLHFTWGPDRRPEKIYVDISTNTTWSDDTVGYIDLDLDLIGTHGSPSIHLVDVDEFEEHRQLWSYPEDLVQSCWAAVEEVRALLTSGKPPFAPSMFAWQPGQPVQ
jgi:protein associated with RNAse G/E